MIKQRRVWPIHLALLAVCFVMLVPFYWVLKSSISGENIFSYPPNIVPRDPHPFYYVDVWYAIPFARYFLNSVVVSVLTIVANVVLNAMAGYALTQSFPGKQIVLMLFLSCMMILFQATIIPAYLITGKLGLLDSYLGLALPMFSTIICIFVFKASFDAVPRSLIDAARVDGLSEWRIIWKVMMPLAKSAVATNVILSFIWSWNNFMWPLIATRSQDMQTLPLGLARFISYQEDTTGALYAFCIMVLAPGILLFLLAQKEFVQTDHRSDQGMNFEDDLVRPRWKRRLVNRFVLVPGVLMIIAIAWNAWVFTHNHGVVTGRVVDAYGAPVEGAEVKLWVFNFTTFVEQASTQTAGDGSFEFTKNPSHNIQLSAAKAGVGRSRIPVRLYFQSEDIVLKRPLQLSSADAGGK
jgi:ABC-type glycerol-3-phosphate transport system permease component